MLRRLQAEHGSPADWSERHAVLLCRIGILLESFIMSFAGVKHEVDAGKWFYWVKEPAETKEEEAIKAAWGDSYDGLMKETTDG